ncbi:MAG: hypothetical protein RLZZ08_247 [Pseudomonadota bacterium]|jgi:hypothetical protein
MPPWYFPALIGVSSIMTLVAGIWLTLHLTAVARIFSGHADIVTAPVRPGASQRVVWSWLAAFVVGLAVSLTVPVLILSAATRHTLISVP